MYMTKPKCSLFVNDQENIMADILAEAALVDSTQLSQGVDDNSMHTSKQLRMRLW